MPTNHVQAYIDSAICVGISKVTTMTTERLDGEPKIASGLNRSTIFANTGQGVPSIDRVSAVHLCVCLDQVKHLGTPCLLRDSRLDGQPVQRKPWLRCACRALQPTSEKSDQNTKAANTFSSQKQLDR